MKKGIWRRVIEYLIAAPILGFPFYTVISLQTILMGKPVIGVITVALLFGLLAFYQLRKVSILGSKKGINAYIILGGVCFITSLLSLLSLIQNISAFSAPNQSIGTVDSTIDNLNALIIPSFGFGFLLGLSILFLGYALLEYKASGMTQINNIPA